MAEKPGKLKMPVAISSLPALSGSLS